MGRDLTNAQPSKKSARYFNPPSPCGEGREERARPSAVQGKAGVKELVISFGANDKRAKEAGK